MLWIGPSRALGRSNFELEGAEGTSPSLENQASAAYPSTECAKSFEIYFN